MGYLLPLAGFAVVTALGGVVFQSELTRHDAPMWQRPSMGGMTRPEAAAPAVKEQPPEEAKASLELLESMGVLETKPAATP